MYLDIHGLWGGDVVLTGSTSVNPIALFTRGRYTHAAIINETGHTFIFEATSKGSGLRLAQDLVRARDGRYYWEAQHIVALRHPAVSQMSADERRAFEGNLMGMLIAMFSDHDYPRLPALADTLHGKWKRRLGRAFLNALERRKKDLREGPFCSMLVAMAYEALDLPLFPPGVSLASISPNDLGRSALRPIPGVLKLSVAIDVVKTNKARLDLANANAQLQAQHEYTKAFHKMIGATPVTAEGQMERLKRIARDVAEDYRQNSSARRNEVLVMGAVANPATYAYEPGMTAARALEAAGGIRVSGATETKIGSPSFRVTRRIDGKMLERGVPPNYRLEPNDIVVIE